MHIYDRDFNYIIETDDITEYQSDKYIITDKLFANPVEENGDIREATRIELFKKGQYELQAGEIYENGNIVEIEYNPELGYLSPVWDKKLHQWLEGATDLEKVQAQINEYSELDTPSTLKEMGTELANECMNMLIELRSMAYTLGNPEIIEEKDLLVLPKPSPQLEAFKNKFKKFF